MIPLPLEVTLSDSALNPSLFKKSKEVMDFICMICGDVACPSIAVEHTGCGHIFCKSCLEPWLNKKDTCPYCKGETNGKIRSLQNENKIVYRYLSSFEVSCPTSANGLEGCKWSGEWSELGNHLKICPEAIVLCSLGCQHKCPRKSIAHHEINMCPHRQTKCIFCDKMFKASELEAHQAKCSMNNAAVLPCKYTKHGCSFNGNLVERTKHYEDQVKIHLELVEKYSETLEKKLKENEDISKKMEQEKKLKTGWVKVSVHAHALKYKTQDNGWACDGKNLPGGCKSGITGFNQTTGIERYRCDACDFDLCRKCLDAYYKPD